MATLQEVEALALANKATITAIQNGTVSPANFSSSQRREILEGTFPTGVAIEINNLDLKVGDKVFGKKAGINSGNWVFGEVISIPVTQDSDINTNLET